MYMYMYCLCKITEDFILFQNMKMAHWNSWQHQSH